ncbi:hypothetical protein SteCoe_9036 [Stentor coeruleus]|uniref:dual-specificity kinase n=1 Tax=Stentor coeruleus TaxID=5963 RepID=A0A1R2CIS3_9CILI|nr:hypothetical protein SteCoe_9036 [Stentor coeruleus]
MLSSLDYTYKFTNLSYEKSVSKSPNTKKISTRMLSKNNQSRSNTKRGLLNIFINPLPAQVPIKINRSTKIPNSLFSSKNASRKLKIDSPLSNDRKSSSRFFKIGSNRSLNLSVSPKNSSLPSEKIEFPIRPIKALLILKNDLTVYEQGEILKYAEIYYVGKIENKLKPNPEKENYGFDDKHADYLLSKNDHIAYRYEILNILGKGSFGQVCECYDHKNKEKVALKIIKNKSKFHQQATIEIRLLHEMREKDPQDLRNIIRMKNYFSFRSHICITFELVSINLYDFLRLNNFNGISMHLIKCFARQILNALDFLKSQQIIHCDLKPENILLITSQKAGIKLIDFGSSCFISERLHMYIQSRFYRAPEIILGVPYSPAIDMWSFGCILAELYSGQPLWPGECEKEQFLLIVSFLGLPPNEIMFNASRKHLFFEGEMLKTNKLNDGKEIIPGVNSLKSFLKVDDCEFIDFLMKCFEWNPIKRMTPVEAMNHPWAQVGEQVKGSFLEKKFRKRLL